jgi:hypothetical protein
MALHITQNKKFYADRELHVKFEDQNFTTYEEKLKEHLYDLNYKNIQPKLKEQ